MDGIINVYKEAGFTSFDVVAKLRGILKQKKIGHTGTLDPDAQGVLPVCLGRATKACDYLTAKDKTYRAVLRLGITTDTQDMSGRILKEEDVKIGRTALEEIIKGFTGKISQVPPMYSALKVDGRKLCDLARKGIEVERKAREITVYSIEILEVDMPLVTMQVHCSKGTYIRTLCHDIGKAAGCGGCMERLLRTKTAGFCVEDAHRLSEIEAIVNGTDKKGRRIEDILVPTERVLTEYPKITAEKGAEKLLENGGILPLSRLQENGGILPGICRMYDASGRFIGLYCYDGKKQVLKPEKMFL